VFLLHSAFTEPLLLSAHRTHC